MGKIAHALAVAHDYTTDYLVSGVKVAGRGVKTGALKVKDTAVDAAQTFSAEHAAVEAERARKREAKAEVEALAEQVVAQAAARPTKPAQKSPSKRTTPRPSKGRTTSPA